MIINLINIVTCDYPLPVPREYSEKLDATNWGSVLFFTSSICFSDLYRYSISQSGLFYLEYDGVKDQVKQIDYTGELNLESVVEKGNLDYEIFVKVLFFKGELKEIYFEKIDVKDNSERLIALTKGEESFHKNLARHSKRWYSLKVTCLQVLSLVPFSLRMILSAAKMIIDYLNRLLYKVEKWMK